jgi:hypothetical protein
MNRELFVHMMNVVEEYDDYFVQRMNATTNLVLVAFRR